jgi:predicted metal-dependent peptidase
MDQQEKLRHARARLLLRFPFFGYLVSNLSDIIDAERTPTAATDGHRVYWNPEFLARLELADVIFVLAHEALHNALGHLSRRGGRSPRIWNASADMAVNDALVEASLHTRLNGLYGAKGESAEKVYERLERLSRETGAAIGPSWDDHSAWELSAAEARELDEAWRSHLAQAVTFGQKPAGLAVEIDARLYPKRDWRATLAEALRFPVDYRSVPPDRRFSQVLLPTLDGSRRRLIIAVDSSGSISPEKLSELFSELRAIIASGPCEGRVLVCDADIQEEFELADFDPAAVKRVKGGGGTDFRPVFTRAREEEALGRGPDALLYLTDLVGSFPEEPPLFRVLWVVRPEDARQPVPFGEVIVLEEGR